MDLKTIFTKTAKGVTQVNQKTQSLSRDLMKVLKVIDGKSNVETLAGKADFPVPATEKALAQLQRDGFIKVFEVKQEVPLTDFGGEEDDFDFTAPVKKPAFNPSATQGFKPSQYRTPASADQVERATSPAPSYAPPPVQRDAELEKALSAAREKAQSEARAKAEREAQIRARLEVEANAKREAENRAIEEAKRAQAAAERARVDLEARVAEENKQRKNLSDTRDRLTRAQIEKEAEHQRALSAARAQAEAEAQALSQARAKAEAEARALAEARIQAEAAAKRQQEELESAQRELRVQLKAEIEAKVRAEMEAKLSVEVEESGRAEVEAAIMAEAREQARNMLEEQLRAERDMLARAGSEAKRSAEVDAKRMLAEQETRIRAEMQAQITKIAEEKARVEVEARRMAEAQAEAASKAAAEFSARLKAEEDARRAAEAESELRKQAEAQSRARLEARAREEAEERAKMQAEMDVRLAAEKEAKIQAQAQALIEAEMREKAERENRAKFEAERRAREEADRANQIKFDAERQAREEAEQKAAMEAKAREVASRAAADQAEARQKAEREAEMRLAAERREAEARLSEERREAEQRFNAERAAREKAEEKARAEEEAEASQRAAQVARLKELSEQHERDLAAGIDPDAKKNRTYGKKKSGGLLRWLVVGAIALVVVGVGLIQVFPLGAVNTRFEKAFATWIHDDVTSTGMHVSLFPKPHVKLNQVALGKVLDAKAESGKLLMDIGDLFGERFTIDTLELTEVSVSYEALMRAAKWGAADRGNGIEISNIALRSAKLEVKGVAIDVFDADIKFSKDGKIVRASARAKDGKWSVDLTPAKSGAGEAADQWTVDFSGRNLNLPFGAPLPLTSVSAKGTMAGDALNFPQVEAKLLEGSASGSLKADWKNGINFTSEFAVEHVKVDQLTQVFTRDVSLGGKLDGQFTAAGSAATIGALLDAPVIQGSFVVKEGAIGNIDLVQAMRSPGSVGGQSKFAELTGQMRVSEGTVRYEKLKLSGGVLLANGNVNVNSANSTLSGVVNSEIRSNVAQDRANFIVTGKVSRPALKRG